MRKSTISLVLILSVFMLGCDIPELEDYISDPRDHNNGRTHWATQSVPAKVQIINNTSAEWHNVLNDAINLWNVSPVVQLSVSDVIANASPRLECPMAAGMIHLCNAEYGLTGWSGHASTRYDSHNHIYKANVRLNESYGWPGIHREYVMCHEIGHTLGLHHTSEDGTNQNTCMDYSMDNMTPGISYETLLDIYNHTDAYSTYTSVFAGILAKAGTTLPKGKLVHKTNKHEIWMAPDTDGGTIVHYITLVQ